MFSEIPISLYNFGMSNSPSVFATRQSVTAANECHLWPRHLCQPRVAFGSLVSPGLDAAAHTGLLLPHKARRANAFTRTGPRLFSSALGDSGPITDVSISPHLFSSTSARAQASSLSLWGSHALFIPDSAGARKREMLKGALALHVIKFNSPHVKFP